MNEDNRVNLEGIMYNEDGTFKPFTDNYGNTNGELAHLRNTYMESERDYFEHLLADDVIRNNFEELMNKDADTLFKYATQIHQKLEYGDLETNEDKIKMQYMTPEERDSYHMKKLERAEGMMCLLYAAASDKAKILELVYTYSGRSR